MTDDYGENRTELDAAIRDMDLIARQELGRRKLGSSHPLYDDLLQEAVIAQWKAREKAASANRGYLRRAAGWRIDSQLKPGVATLGSEGGTYCRPRTVATSPLPVEESGSIGGGPRAFQLNSPLEQLIGADSVDFTERAYMRGVLVQAISELPPKQRAYVVRRFWGGEEASKTLAEDFSHSTWERARAYLRPRLRELMEAGV